MKARILCTVRVRRAAAGEPIREPQHDTLVKSEWISLEKPHNYSEIVSNGLGRITGLFLFKRYPTRKTDELMLNVVVLKRPRAPFALIQLKERSTVC